MSSVILLHNAAVSVLPTWLFIINGDLLLHHSIQVFHVQKPLLPSSIKTPLFIVHFFIILIYTAGASIYVKCKILATFRRNKVPF